MMKIESDTIISTLCNKDKRLTEEHITFTVEKGFVMR